MKIEEVGSKGDYHADSERRMNIVEIEEVKPKKDCHANNVTIEEVEKRNPANDDKKRFGDDWFPLSEGYNRLLCVLWILSSILIAGLAVDEDDAAGAFPLILIVEFVLYLAAIWVYYGFKQPGDGKKA